MENITVNVTISAPMAKVWDFWNKPEHIMKWAFASDDWEAPAAENDLRTGGKFNTVMAAKDKSASFNFNGVYTEVQEHALIEYDIEGGRHVKIEFAQVPEGVKITETFEMEHENSREMQQAGWQSILNNFKNYVETN